MGQRVSTSISETKGGALARGLTVLAAVNDLNSATISGLVAETGLAKPTVVRLVQTLLLAGYVQRDRATSRYSVTPKVASLARSFVGKSPKDAAIQEVLNGLAPELKWPTEYLVPDGHSMCIVMNNRDNAPIKLRLFERRRFPMLQSGAGIIYAASRTAKEVAVIEAASSLNADQLSEVRQQVSQAAQKQYAIYRYRDLALNLSVISILVPGGIGTLSVPHFDDVLPEDKAETVILPKLRAAAKQIAKFGG